MHTAAPHDQIDAVGPRGKVTPDPEATWHLFAADDAGVPATLAMIEGLPAGRRAVAFLEVGSAADEQGWLIEPAAEVEVTWLHRGGEPTGRPDLLADALAGFELPTGIGHAYLSAEAGVVRVLRDQLTAAGLEPSRLSPKAYWVAGKANAPNGEPSREDR